MYNILKHRIFHKGVKQDFINSKTLYGIGVKHSAQQIFQTLAAIKIINKGHINGFSNNKRTSLRPKEPVVQTVRLSPVITIYDRWQ